MPVFNWGFAPPHCITLITSFIIASGYNKNPKYMKHITFNELPEMIAELYLKVTNIESLLSTKVETTPEPEDLLTIRQASKLITLSVPTIYGLVQRSSIPVSKQGKRLYFSKVELIAWIKQGRKKTLSELSTEAELYLTNRRGGASNG